METYAIEHLSFTYPGNAEPALRDINLSIPAGQFLTLCGFSGCGKSTLLRQLKSILSPHGIRAGQVRLGGIPLSQLDQREQTSRIGFVLQNPDSQIVTDKVWHELAFGLENLGFAESDIRLRVAEMTSFFGIQEWFHREVAQLSGGQKQVLNLASVMVMQPEVLILDEPTSQLDPIAAADFLALLHKINLELGVTVIITEQRLEEVLPWSDRLVVMDAGCIIADGSPVEVGMALARRGHGMFLSMPTPLRIHAGLDSDLPCPLTVREGRDWMDKMAIPWTFKADDLKPPPSPVQIEFQEVWFRYERNGSDILKGLSLQVRAAELYAIVGGNGTGKTTALSMLCGLHRPYRGKILITGQDLQSVQKSPHSGSLLGLLPQDPQALFVKKTLIEDLQEILRELNLRREEQEQRINRVVERCELLPLLDRHPYDLSCGEQQRAALAKVLLLEPKILLLDEPTKGMDERFKRRLALILKELCAGGTTIVMVSHDIEFCAHCANRCAMFFDGSIAAVDVPRPFFSGHSFYTTAANRMARRYLPQAITAEDVVAAGGGQGFNESDHPNFPVSEPERGTLPENPMPSDLYQMNTTPTYSAVQRSTWLAGLMIVLAIPATIFFGIYYWDDRQYYIISMLIILEVLLPFLLLFERRRPPARELIIIAVLCAIAVAGRMAFFMLPQFKPVIALVIITGVCMGAETGFLVGAMTALVSNFFIGQGPWTPWQMFTYGIIGFLAGILFQRGWLPQERLPLCLFGGIAAWFIYGGLINPASVLMFQPQPTPEMLLLSYVQGLPFDIIHALSTVLFLLLIARPMIEKLERIKIKFGLVKSTSN